MNILSSVHAAWGFDAFVSMKFAESGKRGPISYAENILREGLKYQPETYTLEDQLIFHFLKLRAKKKSSNIDSFEIEFKIKMRI